MVETNSNPPDNNLVHQEIEKLVRKESGKLLSCLISWLGGFQLAEDALQDAFESALTHWARNGLPRSPTGWLLQTARRKAIDRIRRAKNFHSKQSQIQHLLEIDHADAENEAMQEIPDERLRLIFTCCHPALDEKSRTALTLRMLGGLTTQEIARAFLDTDDAMAQRIVRAKRKIKVAGIPYKVPEPDQWRERLETVLSVLYLIFNEGYFSIHGENIIRIDLCNEAIRLVSILLTLVPGDPEIEGLMALVLLHDSRREARYSKAGDFVPLEGQNRELWNKKKIREGLGYLDIALQKSHPGPYQIQAAISALHSQAINHAHTNWPEIVLLYDELFKFQCNSVVLLNKCVAVSFAENPGNALVLLDNISDKLQTYQPYFATKADLHRRNGETKLARDAYVTAIEMAGEEKTRAFLKKRLEEVSI